MMKKLIPAILLVLSTASFSEIKYKIVEPVTFKNINATSADRGKVIGTGIIEVYTNEEYEDLGKFIKITFPENGLMTNRKKWVPLDRITIDKNDEEFILKETRKQIKIYAVMDRKNLDRGEDAAVIEGEYKGIIPLLISEYGKVN